MKGHVVAIGAVLLTASCVAETVNGVVQWSIERRAIQPSAPRLAKREAEKTYEEVIANEKARGGYFSTSKVGGQEVILQLDTGSSDTWMPKSNAKACQKSKESPEGCELGSYDPEKSDSFKDVGKGEFHIKYVDGSHSTGDYFTDTMDIGGAVVKNLTMGLGVDTDIPHGLVGVGYAINEAIVLKYGKERQYPNLPMLMEQNELINTNAYSLWLNDLDAAKGNILFGGVDTEKYVGDMTRMKLLKEQGKDEISSFMVSLTSFGPVKDGQNQDLESEHFPIPVVLDSGTTLSYLPTDIAEKIWKEVGAIYTGEVKMALLPCKKETEKVRLSFGFAGKNGPRIEVGMDELVLDLNEEGKKAPTFDSGPYKGETACSFGVQNFSSDPFLLGDTFLRSAYVVYDLENDEVGIAATDFNETGSNVVAFPSKGATIPSATLASEPALETRSPDSAYVAPDASSSARGEEHEKPSAGSSQEPLSSDKIILMTSSFAIAVVAGGAFLL